MQVNLYTIPGSRGLNSGTPRPLTHHGGLPLTHPAWLWAIQLASGSISVIEILTVLWMRTSHACAAIGKSAIP
jgi:hypothetical protein